VAGFKRRAMVVAVGLIALAVRGSDPGAYGQSIAYVPVVGQVFDGSTLTVTPVVSDDRRYVRLSVSPFFNTVGSFQNFTTQLGAVSGGGLAGMNGAIGQGGVGAIGDGYSSGMMAAQRSDLLAGPYPVAGGFGDFAPTAFATTLEPGGARPDGLALDGQTDQAAARRASATAPGFYRPAKKSTRTAAKSTTSSRPAARNQVQKSGSSARRRVYARSIDPFAEFE
jgi:hypothetical protein